MKRVTSFLLTLVMLIGMLPGVALPASAAGGELTAYYTSADITVDGKLDESGWLLDQTVGSTPVGMLCSFENLYVGAQTAATTATLTVNGVSVVAEGATLTIGGEMAGSVAYNDILGTMEMMIPLSSVGLTYDVAQEVSFALTAGADSFSGTAILAERTLAMSKDLRDVASDSDISKHMANSTAELWAEQAVDGLHYKTGTMTEGGVARAVPAWTLSRAAPAFDCSKGYELSFNVDFNDLAIPAEVGPIDRFALTGFYVDARTNGRNHIGFHADEAGNIYVTQYETHAKYVKTYDTGLDLPVKDVDVRIVVNDYFEAEVFINGGSVGKFEASGRTGTPGTMYFHTATKYRENDNRKNDLILRDVMLTQAAPNMPLSADRLPRPGVVVQDGSIDESCWSMNTVLNGIQLGLLCDTENLYLALDTDKTSVDFAVGEYTVKTTLGKKPKVAVGYTMGGSIKCNGKGQYEITLPLSLLRLNDQLGEKIGFTVISGSVEKTFALNLGGTALSLAEYVPATDDGLRNATAYLNTDKLTLDGQLKENQWYIAHEAAGPATAPAADFGFLWDGDYLYVGTQVFAAQSATGLELTVGGQTVTADPKAQTASAGAIVALGQSLEWRIPLKDLGIEMDLNVEKDYKLSVTNAGGTSSIHGTLLLAAKTMVLGDACRDFNAKDYTVITADSVKYTKWEQGTQGYNVWTDPALGNGNEAHQHFTSLLNYAGGGDYEFTVDVTVQSLPNIETTLGWRGLCWELREPELQTRFCLRGDGKGGIVMDMLFQRDSHSIDTGVKFGERAVYKVYVDTNLYPHLYVNGEYVGTFPQCDRTSFTIVDSYHMPRMIMQNVNHTRVPDADGTMNAVNAIVHDITLVENQYEDVKGLVAASLEAITEASVLNGANADNVSKLNLPQTVNLYGIPCQVTWHAVDKTSGQECVNVNTATGEITKGDNPMVFDLTATVSCNGVSMSKSFALKAQGKATTSNIALIENDDDPTTGKVTDWTLNDFIYFDTTHNSIVVDQGSAKVFNRITLYDMDEVSRVGQRHLGVFVSDDGASWTKLTNFTLHQDGKAYHIYNVSATARYVKVHSYLDEGDPEGVQPSFYNYIRDMIVVSNEQALPGAGGGFAHTAEYTVKNEKAEAVKDVPVFISIADLGAKAGQYKADCSDFRFTMGERVLAHWYNGKDGFYVRVPDIAAKSSAKVTAHWGCGTAADYSNAEAVFEVAYGNVKLLDLSNDNNMGSHGRPFTLSNGDIIVVGRRASTNGDVAFVRSTDGGRTFNATPQVIMHDSNYKGRALGFGGFLYDDQIDRLWVIAYSGSGSNDRDYRIVLSYTDDCAETWSEPVYLSNAAMPPVQSTDIIVENYKENTHRTITYGNGVALRDRDGDGPNTDYVIITNDTYEDTRRNCMLSFYSKDGGKSWICSDNGITMPWIDASKEFEDGVSESTVAQLDDGSLIVFSRAQEDGNYYLYESHSYDNGKSWEYGYSKVISSNTSPVMETYNDDRLLMWASMTGMGQKSYRRSPMHIGYSNDEYKSFDKILDLTFGTAVDDLDEATTRMTQPGIAFSKDGNNAVVTYWASSYAERALGRFTDGFVVEEFDEFLYNTKGAYDDFETASLKYIGWLGESSDVLEPSTEASASGMYSMKVIDAAYTKGAYATRQIPSMKSGTVGAKVKVPIDNKAPFAMELKAGYNWVHLQHALAAVSVAPDGTVSLCYAGGDKAVAKVVPGSWNDIAISFDIASGMGKLSVNGNVVSDVTLNTSGPLKDQTVEDVVREITCVQFCQTEATGDVGDCVYVDDFYAIELTSALNRATDNISFADVTKGDWYYDAVSFAVENGIMSGYNATKFGPNDTLNRAMVVQVLYNKEGQPNLNGLKHSFSDVPASQWFNNAVTWGSNRGVVSGFGGGVFKPEDAVTIEQVAVILWNYSHTPGGAGDLSKVGNHSDWAANALRWAEGKGILSGVPFTNATEKATRAQTAQMLTNYLRNS